MGLKSLGLGALAVAVLVGACTGEDPASSISTSPDGGSVGPSADAAPGGDGGEVRDGGAVVDERCPSCGLGCSEMLACKRAVPSTAASGERPSGTANLDWQTGPIEIDVGTGAITANGEEVRAAGPGTVSEIGFLTKAQNGNPFRLAIFSVGALRIAPNVDVRIKGTSAVVIEAMGDIVVDGTLSVRPDCDATAPVLGGFPPSIPALNGKSEPYEGTQSDQPLCPGGGGGGNATAGGKGGAAVNEARRTNVAAGGGAAASLLDTPVLFSGGNGGAGGVKNGLGGGAGGKGGGALELVTSGVIRVGGLIDAGGCGGRTGGAPTSGNCRGGAGGGAGGTILLEAAAVRVTGRVLANGGAGAGGSNGEAAPQSGGHASTTTADGAPGGLSAVAQLSCPNGGNGSPGPLDVSGACSVSPSAFRPAAAAGGGGAAGQIVVRTLGRRVDVGVPGIVSPAPALGAVVTD